MSLSQEDLFKLALNLDSPWYIRSIDFDLEDKQLDIHIDFKEGSKFSCPQCGISGCQVHDTIDRTWRHLNFFQFKTSLHCRVPRTKCGSCGVKQVKLPWARKGSGFTRLMDSLIILMSQCMPIKAVADLVGEHDTRMWRVLEYYVLKDRSKVDLSDVKSVGVDETSRSKGYKYISVFINLYNS